MGLNHTRATSQQRVGAKIAAVHAAAADEVTTSTREAAPARAPVAATATATATVTATATAVTAVTTKHATAATAAAAAHNHAGRGNSMKRQRAAVVALQTEAEAEDVPERHPDKRLKHGATMEPLPAPTVASARLLSPLSVASADELRQHVRDVRREVVLRPLLSVVARLMFHKYNHGLFNVRVDPVAWNIPHYVEVVKHPMDLSLVKNKCLNLEYASADECAADIRLVFANACLFNPPGHVVHEAAIQLRAEFEAEYARYQAKCLAQEKRRQEHSCQLCLANVCGICNQKCIKFEPPLVMCSGPCQQRIKRHAIYYKTRDAAHHWCGKCYTALPRVLQLKAMDAASEITMPKQELVKAKFLDELTEPWVQCDKCSGWVHQICVLFNACENSDEEVLYTCPLCRLQELELSAPCSDDGSDVEMSPRETSVDEFPLSRRRDSVDYFGSHSPVPKQKPVAKDFARVLGFGGSIGGRVFEFLDDDDIEQCEATQGSERFVQSKDLKTTALSRFMQSWVREHLRNLGEHDAARSIVVKVVSSIQASCAVSNIVRQHFRSDTQEYPEKIDYTSKAIFVFQKIHGVEVCIFSMYVQEYDENSILPSNRNRTYIAYIDSLVYMRPRRVRTSLFHEILVSYLAFCKSKRFHYAHIWACPTTRGGDFIYWCHPSFQKNPGKDRLLQWYLKMAERGKETGVVFDCRDLFACEFENLEDTLTTRLPPYFDGDYWAAEVERLAACPPKRGKLTKEAYEESLRGQKFRQRLVESVKASRESLFVISLQPECCQCKTLLVNIECWKKPSLEKGRAEFVCETCRSESPSEDAGLERVEPPEFVREEVEDAPEDCLSCPFVDNRADMLKNCEERHHQFDSYRRAKHSTMMLIYQIHATQTQQKA